MRPDKVVEDFCRAVTRRDVDELTRFFAETAVYHNIPLAPVSGRAAIAQTLTQFIAPATMAEFEIRALATAGNTVLTERIDRFVIAGKRIELPVMGAFEVDADGKISAWRDYFDMQMFTRQMG
jgi:limonene-1,2-epoxide hydrolase